MTDKELNKIADLINERVTFAELEEFKHFEQREDREAWVKNQIAKLDRRIIAMTDNIINFQDIKTELEETRHILSSFAFEEVTALNIEQLSNNLIIISNTLEKTIDVVRMLKDNSDTIQEQLIQLGDKVEVLENDMEVLL